MVEAGPRGNVAFVAVARASDKVVVASCAYGAVVDAAAVTALLASEAQMSQVQPGKHYTFASGEQAWHLILQNDLHLIAITAADYPVRHASALLDELKTAFLGRVGDKARNSKAGKLSADCQALFLKLCAKYDDRANFDNLGRAAQKVDGVKLIMQDNIEMALQSCVSLEAIDRQADDLQTQAGMFKTRAKTLRSQMWWKKCRMCASLPSTCVASVLLRLGWPFPRLALTRRRRPRHLRDGRRRHRRNRCAFPRPRPLATHARLQAAIAVTAQNKNKK
ncbi:synaptobrevin-domain-containing protein [Pelagophyceae sp. CCMP2097]|nr:synaptobrevin-domain-containing protein [Pelagophyceae sp. CCMP2097]